MPLDDWWLTWRKVLYLLIGFAAGFATHMTLFHR